MSHSSVSSAPSHSTHREQVDKNTGDVAQHTQDIHALLDDPDCVKEIVHNALHKHGACSHG